MSCNRSLPRKRVLFIVGPALGHVGRSLMIARSLAKHGFLDICFACISPGYGEKIVGTEFPVSELIYSEKGDLKFASNLEIVMADTKADLICLDLTPLPWLHQVLFPNTPQIYITNYFLTELGDEPTLQDAWYSEYQGDYNRNRRLRGLDPLVNGRELYERDAVLLADPPALLQGMLGKIPLHYKIVGSCVWQPDDINSKISVAENTILYISLGSTGSQPIPVELINELAIALDIDKIIWVGAPPQFRYDSSSKYTYQYFEKLPASSILPNAKLAITQGGAGSTYQALGYGVPVAVWPTHRNHVVLGKVIESNDFGVLLEKNWREDIERLVRNIKLIRQHIFDVQAELSFNDSPTKAAHVINKLLF